MPAGVTWGVYLRYMAAAMLTMFAGSQFVHAIYHPLDDLDKIVDVEIENLQRELAEAAKKGKVKLKDT